MKNIAKLTIVAALAAFTSTSAIAGPFYQTTLKLTPRTLVSPVAEMKCDSMFLQGDARHGTQRVSCERFAKLRPTECRIACSKK